VALRAGSSFLMNKRLEREVDHPYPSSTEVRNERSYTYTPSYQ
jgi:hypothetical protein